MSLVAELLSIIFVDVLQKPNWSYEDAQEFLVKVLGTLEKEAKQNKNE